MDIRQYKNDSIVNIQFDSTKQSFLDHYFNLHPEWATELGWHKYDTILSIKDETYYNQLQTFIQDYSQRLETIDTLLLSYDNYIDYALIRNELQRLKWQYEVLKSDEWNPSVYNVTGAISMMLSEPYAPLAQRLKDIAHRIKKIPAYYKQAQINIQDAVPELAQLAIDQNKGGMETMMTSLIDSVMYSNLSPFEKSDILEHNQIALRAIKDYIKFLEKNMPQYKRSFRLGNDLYATKYNFEIQSAYTAEQMYNKALARVQYIHQEMYKLSDSLWNKYYGSTTRPTDSLQMIKQVLDTIAAHHVSADSFQLAIEKQIPELIDFVTQKDLLYIDPAKPLVVRPEPGYLVGIAGASISAPGPFDSMGTTYYNVGSFKGWSADKIESYLREYNHYTLQILNIHEAIPGHYTQLVYANKASSLIKSIFGNNAMIEGWAVYTEQMMLENGYGDNAPEMWLMWYKWNLRTVYNMIIDYEIHTQELSEEATIQKLTHDAFQELTEAQNKWRRATVTNIQLTSYYTGYEEIIELREHYQKKAGSTFTVKDFNEKFLSHGSIPVKYIAPYLWAQ